ncbi:MAG: helix-turn-helix transcriptional regulator [Hyphomicrobiaceae bacterium]|nr:helix-turn-helix transcriptional regulator [Hyphomicrobiaceae bacterium]
MAVGKASKARRDSVNVEPKIGGDIARARAPTSMDQHIGRRLREARLARNLSLIDLASRADLAPQQLQKYETARTRVSASRLYQLAVILDRPVFWFFETH